MIDESIMEKIIPLPDEDEEMEKVQGELEGEGFPITNFKKGGIFYHLFLKFLLLHPAPPSFLHSSIF